MPSPQDSLLVLNLIPGLGSMRIQALLEFFGSAELVLEAQPSLIARVHGIGSKLAGVIASWRSCTNVERELGLAAQAGVRLVTLHDEEYPPALRLMHHAPVVLYVKGAWIGGERSRSISIVGARLATPYGMNVARGMARELGAVGATIISGLARGIDAAAHWGALDAGAPTIGVLGSGHACFFPDENRALADRMVAQGGSVVSEFAMEMRPSRTSFPQRNHIVAAWSSATLVAEAPLRSGSLHTARLAAEDFGHPVFAIPGAVDKATSAGCHELIRDGAILACSAQHIIDDLGWLKPRLCQLQLFSNVSTPQQASQQVRAVDLGGAQRSIAEAIAQGVDTLDAMCLSLGKPAHELTQELMRMQIAGLICPLEGARFKNM